MTPIEDLSMGVTFSIKNRITAGKWEHVDINAIAGKTLEKMFLDFEGKEIVAEFVFGEEKFYFCGTPHWTERMARKGKAVSFITAVDILRTRRPELLGEIVPGIQDVAEVFPGSVMEGCTMSGSGERQKDEG
jgi:hypothetical protein